MAVDKKALNLEMLKLVGFTCTGGIWSYPDGVDVDNGVPFFPGSLDECLKWIVPKLTFWEIICYNKLYHRAYVWAGENSTQFGKYEDNDCNYPATTFCLAVRELK